MSALPNRAMRILEVDIETAPHKVYAWGLYDQDIAINQIVEPGYTLCWSAKWHGSRELMFDSVWHSGKRRMIQRIYKLLTEADAIVHYNGLKFDIPTLNQEFLQIGLKPPPPSDQIDLYQTAKRRFRFASNKLDYVAKQLGLGRKLPHKGMDLWAGCMNGNKADQRTMERYNRQDVRLLERVYVELLPWIKGHPNHGIYLGRAAVCPNCGGHNMRSNGWRYTHVAVYRRLICSGCGAPSRSYAAEKRVRGDGTTIKVLRAA